MSRVGDTSGKASVGSLSLIRSAATPIFDVVFDTALPPVSIRKRGTAITRERVRRYGVGMIAAARSGFDGQRPRRVWAFEGGASTATAVRAGR